MNIDIIRERAQQIYELHRTYTLGNDITFDAIDPSFSVGFCRVHHIYDKRYVVVVSPMSQQYAEGEIEVNSEGSVQLIVKTDLEKAGKLAESTIKRVLSALKSAIEEKGLTPKKIETEKQKRIKELEKEIETLKGGDTK